MKEVRSLKKYAKNIVLSTFTIKSETLRKTGNLKKLEEEKQERGEVIFPLRRKLKQMKVDSVQADYRTMPTKGGEGDREGSDGKGYGNERGGPVFPL